MMHDTFEALGFTFDETKVAKARAELKLAPNHAHARFIAERGRVDFVFHTAALEGNPFTFPEVKTLLEGVTVGGHKVSDADQVLRLNEALSDLLTRVKALQFDLNENMALSLHAKVAKDEALTYGEIRSGQVFIQGTQYQVPDAKCLPQLFQQGSDFLNALIDPIMAAFLCFLWGSLRQFFFDGNKRTSRLLSNGLLLSAGYPPMLIEASEQLAYNQIMTRFYDSQEATEALLWFFDRYRARIAHYGFPTL